MEKTRNMIGLTERGCAVFTSSPKTFPEPVISDQNGAVPIKWISPKKLQFDTHEDAIKYAEQVLQESRDRFASLSTSASDRA